LSLRSDVGRNALSPRRVDCRGCDADIKLAFDQRMRDAVVVAVNINVIVNMYAGFFPFGVFIGFGGQGINNFRIHDPSENAFTPRAVDLTHA
jgi:hypothetical protein